MVTNIISLEEKDNPEYYKLADEYNSLVNQWNGINNKLHKFRIRKIWLFGTKSKLIAIGKEVGKLQESFLDWYARAWDFFTKPHYNIDPNSRGDIIYLHFTSVMGSLSNRMKSDMLLLVENHNKVCSIYKDQINFLIAIGAFSISFIGLTLSFIGLVLAIN